MSHHPSTAAATLCALAAIPTVLFTQQAAPPANTVNITVTVVSATTRAPVAGVTLRLRTIPEASVVTDSLGRAAFVGVPKRMEGIEAAHAEFEPRTEVLLLRDGDFDEVRLTVPLKPRGVAKLGTVSVTAVARVRPQDSRNGARSVVDT